MAGSYSHVVTDNGELVNPEHMMQMIERGGDVYETVEEMFGMIWLLALGDPALVERARKNYELGLTLSPGFEETI